MISGTPAVVPQSLLLGCSAASDWQQRSQGAGRTSRTSCQSAPSIGPPAERRGSPLARLSTLAAAHTPGAPAMQPLARRRGGHRVQAMRATHGRSGRWAAGAAQPRQERGRLAGGEGSGRRRRAAAGGRCGGGGRRRAKLPRARRWGGPGPGSQLCSKTAYIHFWKL